MSERTQLLDMPFIMPAQAQKHVTHNEALQKLDCMVQLVLLDIRKAPPPGAQDGDGYLVASAPSGLWAGMAGRLAFMQDGGWQFTTPRDGWRAWFANTGRMMVLTGGEWSELPLPETARFMMLGVNADPDSINRLAMNAPATLLNHAGAGHQLKINKAGAAETASLLFQSAWNGHAEMGLAGDNSFSIKVSADGANWNTGMTINGNGRIGFPNRPVVAAGNATSGLTVTGSSNAGFSVLSHSRGGFALGNPLSGATGRELLVPSSGIYFAALTLAASGSAAHAATLTINGSASSLSISAAQAAVQVTHGATALLALSAGDRLALSFSGTASIEFGEGKTALTLVAM